jgi:hypothetical protein
VEQTEVDALATLRPDVLEQLTLDAIAHFDDTTLAERAGSLTGEPPPSRPPAIQAVIGELNPEPREV